MAQAVAAQQVADAVHGVAVVAENQRPCRADGADQRKQRIEPRHRSRAHDSHCQLGRSLRIAQKIERDRMLGFHESG